MCSLQIQHFGYGLYIGYVSKKLAVCILMGRKAERWQT